MPSKIAIARFSRNTSTRASNQGSIFSILRAGLLAAVAAVTLLAGSQAHAQEIAFVLNNNPTILGTTTPDFGHSYNSSGGAITIYHPVKGFYYVTFAGLGSEISSNVQVSGYGSGSNFCVSYGWGWPYGYDDVEIEVNCYGKNGGAEDVGFTVLYQARTNSDATHPNLAFVDSVDRTKSSYTPYALVSYNSTGGTNTIKRASKGNYEVYLPGFNTTGGNVMVTPDGNSAHCQVSHWGRYDAGTVVYVNCTNVHGDYADEYFQLVYSIGQTAGYGAGSDAGGAILAYDDTEKSNYDVSELYSIPIDDKEMHARNIGTGEYVWTMTVNPTWASSTVLVTAYDAPGNYCNVKNWESNSETTDVYVNCFNSEGKPANTRFTATFQTAGTD
jgi:hypothetical protein